MPRGGKEQLLRKFRGHEPADGATVALFVLMSDNTQARLARTSRTTWYVKPGVPVLSLLVVAANAKLTLRLLKFVDTLQVL